MLSATSSNRLAKEGSAGLVVFLVALPLCLGIALGSGAPLFGGIISGVVGGVVVGLLSGSQVSVSGPAAGLAVIVYTAIQTIGTYESFLVAVVLSGLFQLAFSVMRLGKIVDYVPNSVIKGMLAGLGLLIILKQIPHALGRDNDFMGDFKFLEPGGNTMFSDIASAIASATAGPTIIFLLSLSLLIAWDKAGKRSRIFQLVPGQLAVVAMGIALNQLFASLAPSLHVANAEHLVQLPVPKSVAAFFQQFALPDFTALSNKAVWTTALTIAVVGSVETLLSLEAADRLDPYKRISSPDRELRAQGVGNIVSGLIGGLPLTSVIVRTAANVEAGGSTRLSAVIHGFLLLGSVIVLPGVLRLTPLASLATILILVGCKLTKPALYRATFRQGWDQFVPFIVTTVAVVFLDLLTGVLVGLACGVFFVIRTNHHEAITVVSLDSNYLFRFTKDASFVNKNEFRTKLRQLPEGSKLLVDGTRALFIDHDILEILDDFRQMAQHKNIQIDVKHWEKLPAIAVGAP